MDYVAKLEELVMTLDDDDPILLELCIFLRVYTDNKARLRETEDTTHADTKVPAKTDI